MSEKKVNNWKAADELESFKQKYCDPQNKRVEDARKILEDSTHKWKKGEKVLAKAKLAAIDTANIDLHRLHSEMLHLIVQHESLTDMLTEIYAQWYNNVSVKGEQKSEMMSAQAELLQSYFQRVYDAIEPLKLELLPPKIKEL